MGPVCTLNPAYLIDTHVLLWWWHGDARLSPNHIAVLQSQVPIFVSHASLWEMAIKISLGKLETIDNPIEKVPETGFETLSIKLNHIDLVGRLAFHHRDPFDRMLIAQAQAESLAILSADPAFRLYDVEVI